MLLTKCKLFSQGKHITYLKQVVVFNILQEKKVNNQQLYPHIIFAKCQQLIKSIANNQIHHKNKHLAEASGIGNRPGRPHLTAQAREDEQEVVTPRIQGYF